MYIATARSTQADTMTPVYVNAGLLIPGKL